MPDVAALAARFVSALPGDQRAALAQDPFAALQSLGFEIRMRPNREISGQCSVAASLDHGPPPRITVIDVPSVGRQHFSALHEYGHWAIANDGAIQDVFFEQRDGGVGLEEHLCDAIAAGLLLPASSVDSIIGPAGPTASDVWELIHSFPNASVEACCVRAAERINGPGHVMVVRDGVAQFTASHSTLYRVRRGAPQAADHISVRAARLGRAAGQDSVTYASGTRSVVFFADAVADEAGGLVIAVFMENRPPWVKGLALPAADPTADAEVEAYCVHCEVDFVALGAPCPKCEGHFHRGPNACGRCACKAATQHRLCPNCFIQRTPAEYTPGEEFCNYCLGL